MEAMPQWGGLILLTKGRVRTKGLGLTMLVVAVVSAPLAQAQTPKTIYSFMGGADGNGPVGTLITDSAGNLYGTTSGGGSPACSAGCGTVFKVDTNGNETVLYSFGGVPDGAEPFAGLIRDEAGNLYGTTLYGGAYNLGSVFEVDATGNETVLHSFQGQTDGALPMAALVRDKAGNLYGTTFEGGDPAFSQGCGAVFVVSPNGKERVLHAFAGEFQGDGCHPQAGLTLLGGSLYGTTSGGGPYGALGVVFKVSPQSGSETIVYPIGGQPEASLISDPEGNLYGTSVVGGTFFHCYVGLACGSVFELYASGTATTLYSFAGPPDGASPVAGLVRDAAGNLYGTTLQGGDLSCFPGFGCGTVFKLDASGKEVGRYIFTGTPDGANPMAGLTKGAGEHLLYGATQGGGAYGYGEVFELAP
jgi:uncharacterized repeat protein (TIGR03803 family)